MRPHVGVPTMATVQAASAQEVPVLVAGAGPAGLATAIELTRHDVPTLLVERRTRLSSHPRATVLSLRSMEIVRAWGLEAGVRARSVEVDWRMLETETLADAAAGTASTSTPTRGLTQANVARRLESHARTPKVLSAS
jgi:2-polyprenyl-6-methoxyphenol hydroxylase-like FAD-dependent oxidoreductase